MTPWLVVWSGGLVVCCWVVVGRSVGQLVWSFVGQLAWWSVGLLVCGWVVVDLSVSLCGALLVCSSV